MLKRIFGAFFCLAANEDLFLSGFFFYLAANKEFFLQGAFCYLAANKEWFFFFSMAFFFRLRPTSVSGAFFYLVANEEFLFPYSGLPFLVSFFFIRGNDITLAGRFPIIL